METKTDGSEKLFASLDKLETEIVNTAIKKKDRREKIREVIEVLESDKAFGDRGTCPCTTCCAIRMLKEIWEGDPDD